jgi:hypothetical protein
MDYTLRYRNIIDPARVDMPIEIVGAGGIGSPLALMLVKMGYPRVKVWDSDIIEAHNVGAQMYPLANVGKLKVEALRELIEPHKYERQTVEYEPRVWQAEGEGLLIMGVDSMAARQGIWSEAQTYRHVIDARMGGELLRIYSVDMANEQARHAYEVTLHDDSEGAELPCTARSVLYNVFVCAGIIGAQMTRLFKHEPYEPALVMDMKNMILLNE